MAEPPTPAAPTLNQKLLAWSVHLFTASGAVLALLALAAVLDRRWNEALLWLFAALVVDGIDGTFARAARVKEIAPRIDGDTLDLVIDYLSYVFVPTLFLWRAELIPAELAPLLGALIQLSSLYVFARRDMKTDDGYFRGFPALWNLVALYLYVTAADPAVGALAVIILAAMSFAPVHFVHPFRVRDFRPWLPILALVWSAATLALLLPLGEGLRDALLALSVTVSVLLVLLGLVRTFRGPSGTPAQTAQASPRR
jgi:phosphatidylcholine synthase